MSSKSEKELQRLAENAEAAVPNADITGEMSPQERIAMRGMVVWNVAECPDKTESETTQEPSKWESLAKKNKRGGKKESK
jgi:hypothetical protein